MHNDEPCNFLVWELGLYNLDPSTLEPLNILPQHSERGSGAGRTSTMHSFLPSPGEDRAS